MSLLRLRKPTIARRIRIPVGRVRVPVWVEVGRNHVWITSACVHPGRATPIHYFRQHVESRSDQHPVTLTISTEVPP